MKKKDEGNIMIESIAALMILGVALSIAMTSIISVNKSNSKRSGYDEVKRVVYAVMNEVKYNYSYNDIKDEINHLGVGNCISIKYSDDILDKLTRVELLNLEKGNEIKIEVLSEDNINKIIQMKVSINIQINGEVIKSERSFDKMQWMDP